MLQNNLERQGVDLSIENDLLYVDVTNGRIGVLTANPTVEFDVDGTINAVNITASTQTVGTSTLTSVDTGNIHLENSTISTTNTDGNLIIAPNGTGVISVNNTKISDLAVPALGTDATNKFYVDSLFGNLEITGNALVSNTGAVFIDDDLSVSGNLQVTGDVIYNNLQTGNISIAGNTISAVNTDGNINLVPNGNGLVEIGGTYGFIPPVGSSGDRPVNPVEGLTRYNNSTNLLEFYNGSEWAIAGPNAAVITSQALEGDGSTITFTLDKETSTEGIIVSINGTVQKPTDSYVVSGTQITFQEIPHFGDSIDIRFITITLSFGDTSLPVYTRSQILSMTNVTTGTILYSLDGDSGSPCLAVYNGSNWKKIALTENL